jgi:hypothetical protein
MMGKRILFFCFVLLLAVGARTCFARLGEDQRAIQQRYGPPASTTDVQGLQGVTRCQYHKIEFVVTVFYQDGHSILEIFASRGLSQEDAHKVVYLVATHPVGAPAPAQEERLRQAAGITCKEEVFWTWTTPTLPINAAYDPVECTLTFFSDPDVYARIERAVASMPIAGF